VAFERALRRKDQDEIRRKGKAAHADRRRRATTSARSLADDSGPEDWGRAHTHDVWERHNILEACACHGCLAYARDLLDSILEGTDG